MAAQKSKSAQRIVWLLAKPRRLLIALLLCNTSVNVTLVSLAMLLSHNMAEQTGLNIHLAIALNVIIVACLILVIGELSPKIAASRNPLVFAHYASLILAVIYVVIYPVVLFFDYFILVLSQILRIKAPLEERLLRSEEIQTLLNLGEEQGKLEEEEKEMIHSIFEFGEITVREIMVPRMNMICISIEDTCTDLIELIKRHGHTRIPLFEDTIDHIRGIINAKDLLPHIRQHDENIALLQLSRPAFFVPESKKIDDLLREFQHKRQHMAIVVDEYGGTSGIVTLEDILEQIVGDIHDEYDKDLTLYKKIDEQTFLVDAQIDIESLNDLTGLNIPLSDEYDTLGGFILELKGSFPDEKEVIHYGDVELDIIKMEKNRIATIKIRLIPPELDGEAPQKNLQKFLDSR